MTRDELLQAVQRLWDFEQGPGSEAERDAMISALDRAVPHADISDLIYYGERDRTHEEIVDEALVRERIWAEDGEVAVRARIEAQLLEALADPTVPDHHYTKISARTLLKGMRSSPAH